MRSHSKKKVTADLSQIEDENVRETKSATNLYKSTKSADHHYPTAAITFNSIAIGVGNAVTSIVVRVGFGLAGPAKYSA